MANRSPFPMLQGSERNLWNSRKEMSRLQNRIDRMFEQYFSDPFSATFQDSSDLIGSDQEYIPPCDVAERDTQYLLSFDLPGVKRHEIKIEARDGQLIVSGERKEEQKEEKKGRVSQEKYYGSFMRSFTLPSDLDANQIEAHFEDGVLQIAIPKVEKSKGKQIPIQERKSVTQDKQNKDGKAA